jgi:hypothetical protein
MREIIDSILELEKHEGNGAVVEISDLLVVKIVKELEALRELENAAREYWNRYNSDCENSELIKAENRLEFLLTKVDEARQG